MENLSLRMYGNVRSAYNEDLTIIFFIKIFKSTRNFGIKAVMSFHSPTVDLAGKCSYG